MTFQSVYEDNDVEVLKITPEVYFRKSDLYSRGQCNGAYFVGDTGVAIVDAPQGAIEMIDEVRTLFDKPVRYLFLTHAHGDHFVDLPLFYDMDITIFCSRRVLEKISPDIKGHRANIIGVDGTTPVRLSGGMEVELFTLPDMTHSKWDMFIRLPEEGILYTGDCVIEYKTACFHNADINSWISQLRRLAKSPDRLILPGHGDKPYEYAYIHDFIYYLVVIERAAWECFAAFGVLPDGAELIENISTDMVRTIVEDYFAKKSEDALYIESCAGPDDARRVVRMVLWSFARSGLA